MEHSNSSSRPLQRRTRTGMESCLHTDLWAYQTTERSSSRPLRQHRSRFLLHHQTRSSPARRRRNLILPGPRMSQHRHRKLLKYHRLLQELLAGWSVNRAL
uniref:(northern house mosquito) hypothetical protein n=1 Tax=Culex pipiens TaxID=7175 RepID=A0A8D8NAC3_CULPI